MWWRFLPQGIFLAQAPNLGLLHCRQILYWLSHQGNLLFLKVLFFKVLLIIYLKSPYIAVYTLEIVCFFLSTTQCLSDNLFKITLYTLELVCFEKNLLDKIKKIWNFTHKANSFSWLSKFPLNNSHSLFSWSFFSHYWANLGPQFWSIICKQKSLLKEKKSLFFFTIYFLLTDPLHCTYCSSFS